MKTTTTPSGTGRARLGLIVSMTVFGTIGLFVRRIEITSAELALCRAGLAAVFLLLYFLVTRRRLCLSEIEKSLWLLLASGAAMGITWMLLFEAYKYTTISLATLSYYLAPVIVTALCPPPCTPPEPMMSATPSVDMRKQSSCVRVIRS